MLFEKKQKSRKFNLFLFVLRRFFLQWFVANYLFQLALEPSDTSMVTLLSSTSSLFTLVLAAAFPSASGDKFTLSKVTAVAVSIAGVTMVTLSELEEPKMSKGIFLALTSAFFYASYLVLVKRKSDTEEKIDIPLFFGKFIIFLCFPFYTAFCQFQLVFMPTNISSFAYYRIISLLRKYLPFFWEWGEN